MMNKKIQDIWECKDSQNPAYPTEKNRAMLGRIIAILLHKYSRVYSRYRKYSCRCSPRSLY